MQEKAEAEAEAKKCIRDISIPLNSD